PLAFDASLEPRATAQAIVDAAVPDLAEVCVIDILLPVGSIGTTAVAAVDPAIAERLEETRRVAPIDGDGAHPVAEVLRRERAMVVRDLEPNEVRSRVADNDEHRKLMVEAGYSSAAIVPMLARGRMRGVLSFLHGRGDRRYDPTDLSVLTDLAGRAALALDNAYLYSERDSIAQILQAGLRPDAP